MMQKMQEDNDNLCRRIGLISGLDAEGQPRVAPGVSPAASGASVKHPVVSPDVPRKQKILTSK